MRLSKILIPFLLLLFVAVVGMFYYSNFYTVQQEEKNMVNVMVAKKDVAEGSVFSAENVGIIKMKKDNAPKAFLTDFSKVEGKQASSSIYKDEVLTAARMVNEKEDEGTTRHTLSIIPDNELQNIADGDTIRVFVRPDRMSQIYNVYDMKEVKKLNMKSQSSGGSASKIQSIDIFVSDAEVYDYERAAKNGDILVVRYNDLKAKSVEEFIDYRDIAIQIERLLAYADKNDDEGTYYSAIYQAGAGDTWESISKKFNVPVEALKKVNPTILKLKKGDMILVS